MRSCIASAQTSVGKYLKTGRRISSGETGKTVDLSPEDMRVIRKSWDAVKDKDALGHKIFFLIFTQKPELKKLFRIEADSVADLLQNERLQRHARVFVGFLDALVCELYEEGGPGEGPSQALVNLVRSAGLAHCQVRSMQFTAENWLVFKSVVCEVMGKTESASGKTYMAWAKLLAFVISEMKDAYLYGVRRNTWPSQEAPPLKDTDQTPNPTPDAEAMDTAPSPPTCPLHI